MAVTKERLIDGADNADINQDVYWRTFYQSSNTKIYTSAPAASSQETGGEEPTTVVSIQH